MIRPVNALALGMTLLGTLALADVKLPAIIGDNMVLQKKSAVPIWGQADPGEQVRVEIHGQQTQTTADASGAWKTVLDLSQFPPGPWQMTISGKNKLTLQNVLVGQVWLCSGQSNMEFGVGNCPTGKQDIAAANLPAIRLFMIPHRASLEPQTDVAAQWVVCTPQTLASGGWNGFSGVGYYFGREIHQQLNTPVGLIQDAWGGSPAEAFVSTPTLAADPDLRIVLDHYSDALRDFPAARQKYQQQLAAWEKTAAAARASNAQPTTQPRSPRDPRESNGSPGLLYNGMIAPLIPYAIAGTIWYQGESNSSRAYQYRKLFPTMIQDWRKHWGQGDFPFLFVQLPNFMDAVAQPGESDWAELREAQSMTLSLPNTAMAVAIDVGDARDIHPKNKQDVGHRLALAALAQVYGRPVEFSGPVYQSMTVAGNSIRVTFTHAQGLTAKGDKLAGFALAGADRKFFWADATINGQTILLHSDQVAAPIAVRYGWSANPNCNLYNQAGLPASPFRTDDWPCLTANNR